MIKYPKTSDEKAIFIEGDSGPLEALLHIPEQPFTHIGVVCHPHPLYGGTMHNKVVHTAIKAFQEQGLATVRFNFRGIGQSAGSYGAGEGEADDLKSVLAWAQKNYPTNNFWLAGFSFGSYVAMNVGVNSDFPIEQLIMIAPPVENFPAIKELKLPTCPWVIVQGDADEIVDPKCVFQWVHSLTPPPTLITMPGAGHFFHGQLGDLRKRLVEYLGPPHTLK